MLTRWRGCPFSSRLIDFFFPRMEPPMRFLEVGDGQMQVTLRRGQGAVPEDLLDMPQVRPVFEQVRGAGVPPDVTGDVLFDFRCLCVVGDQFAEHVFVERLAPQ